MNNMGGGGMNNMGANMGNMMKNMQDIMNKGGWNGGNMGGGSNNMNNMGMNNMGGGGMNNMGGSMGGPGLNNMGGAMGGGSGMNMGGQMGPAGAGPGMNNMGEGMNNMGGGPLGPMGNPMGGTGPMSGGSMGPMPGMHMNMGLNMNAPPVMNPTVSSNIKRGSGLLPNPAAENMAGIDELSDTVIGPRKPGDGDHPDSKRSGMAGMIPTMDPNLAAAWGGWAMAPDGQMVRQPIVYSKCVLFPPNPNAPTPTLREKPVGCRTIFIGGIPENTTEEVVRDIFEKCGPIQTVRMSKKNFCHIRFLAEEPVGHAVLLSGWRLRIDNQMDQANQGRVHIDYAQARDDQQEYESRQRQIQREERHRMRAMEDMTREQERMRERELRRRAPSPPACPHYTDGEAHALVEALKSDGKFSNAVEVLETWLARGDCSKRNVGMFYTMIQAANVHVKRLLSEKDDFETEMQRLRDQWKIKISLVNAQFEKIESVFDGASHQKVWDHFTKAQRKNIQTWKTLLVEAKTVAKKTAVKVDEAVEMDVSDEDSEEEEKEVVEPKQKRKKNDSIDTEKLKAESEDWAQQASAYRNEVESVKADMSSDLKEKDSQIKILQTTLQGMQKQLMEMTKKKAEADAAPPKPKVLIPLKEAESRMLAVISTYLNTHPYGVTTDYVWTHILKIDSTITKEQVTGVLETYKDCFSCQVDSDNQKTWKFVAFDLKY